MSEKLEIVLVEAGGEKVTEDPQRRGSPSTTVPTAVPTKETGVARTEVPESRVDPIEKLKSEIGNITQDIDATFDRIAKSLDEQTQTQASWSSRLHDVLRQMSSNLFGGVSKGVRRITRRVGRSRIGRAATSIGRRVATSRYGRRVGAATRGLLGRMGTGAAARAGGGAAAARAGGGAAAARAGGGAAAAGGAGGGAAAAGGAAVLGPIAIAVAVIVGAFVAVAVAGKFLADKFRAIASGIEDLSPDLSRARALADRDKMFASLDRASDLGPQLARLEEARGQLDVEMYRVQSSIYKILLNAEPALTTGFETLSLILKGVNQTVQFAEQMIKNNPTVRSLGVMSQVMSSAIKIMTSTKKDEKAVKQMEGQEQAVKEMWALYRDSPILNDVMNKERKLDQL